MDGSENRGKCDFLLGFEGKLKEREGSFPNACKKNLEKSPIIATKAKRESDLAVSSASFFHPTINRVFGAGQTLLCHSRKTSRLL